MLTWCLQHGVYMVIYSPHSTRTAGFCTFYRHWLSCTGCWQYLLNMKLLMYGLLFMNLFASLRCFCPRTVFLETGLVQWASYLTYLYTKLKIYNLSYQIWRISRKWTPERELHKQLHTKIFNLNISCNFKYKTWHLSMTSNLNLESQFTPMSRACFVGVSVSRLNWYKVGRLVKKSSRFMTQVKTPGPRLNIKTVLSTYGDFHVRGKTAVRTSYL